MELCKRIVATGGPVLELAAGPGGGNFSPLKHIEPDVPIILNDLEPRILSRWHRYMRQYHPHLPVTYIAFDACSMPLSANSLACVSSAGGISSILGSHQEVLKECARVLRPGGILAGVEMVFTERCVHSLPGKLISAMVYHPWLFREWRPLFMAAGLSIESNIGIGGSLLDPKSSALALDAASFGVTLEVEYRAIVASKRVTTFTSDS